LLSWENRIPEGEAPQTTVYPMFPVKRPQIHVKEKQTWCCNMNCGTSRGTNLTVSGKEEKVLGALGEEIFWD
jgi:hypothetical protein